MKLCFSCHLLFICLFFQSWSSWVCELTLFFPALELAEFSYFVNCYSLMNTKLLAQITSNHALNLGKCVDTFVVPIFCLYLRWLNSSYFIYGYSAMFLHRLICSLLLKFSVKWGIIPCARLGSPLRYNEAILWISTV